MNDSQGTDRDFIEYVVKQIVDEPDAVEVTRAVDELGVLITLKVGKFDMGKVIGKNGQTAKSLRTLLRVIGSKNNARVNLKIIEPEGSEMGQNAPATEEASAEAAPAEMPAEEAAPMTEAPAEDSSAPFAAEAPEAPATEEAAPSLEEDEADKHSDMPDDLDLEI